MRSGEVEVTDPSHPLYGRRFPIHSISRSAHGPVHVFVIYREHMHLRIPVHATDLAPCPPATVATKLTVEAMEQVISLLMEWQIPCDDPPASGSDSPHR